MAAITLDRVSKVFDKGTVAVDGVDLEIADGEFMVLVGPSGCGKSTLLRMIAGLEAVTDGGILIGGQDVTYAPARDRDVAMVFQNYALYPHMTVRRNLAFGLKLRKVPKVQIAERVDTVATTLGLTDLLDRKPAQLSGGQRQRVAMGRALVRDPLAFLMDEPLSNLDAKLRVSVRGELADLHARTGTTTIYVTHDQIEAMTLGQRVAVLRDGVLQQCDHPTVLFHEPSNLFVAGFIGSPQMNLAHAVLEGGRVRLGSLEFDVPAPPEHGGPVVLGIRPSDLVLAAEGPSLPQFVAAVDHVENLGAHLHASFAVDADPVEVDVVGDDEAASTPEQGVGSRWSVELTDGTAVTAGTSIDLAVRVDRLHWFDPGSGQRLPTPAD